MLRALAELCGGREVLDLAQACLVEAPAVVHAALDELIAIANALDVRYPELPLYFDLGELRGYHYHTGVVFAAFVPGVGQSIAQGGRYDDIGADFGRARPATGFSTDLKSLVTLGEKPLTTVTAGIWAPDVHDVYLWQAVRRLRGLGERVVQALPGQLQAAAVQAHCDRQLVLRDGQWQVAPLNS
jgi:ATP phosphoribosyltransferase regulatory subunit